MTAMLTFKGKEITMETMGYFWGQISRGNYIYWDHNRDELSQFVGQFLWAIKKRSLLLSVPNKKGILTKEDARTIVNLKCYRSYSIKESNALNIKSLALEELFRDTLMIPFLASIMSKPKYLLAGGVRKKGDKKAKSAISSTDRDLECCFDRIDEVAWFLWAVMTGDDGVSVNILNKDNMEITLKEFNYSPMGATENTAFAGKVGSFASWLKGLSYRDALQMYEKVVYGNEHLPVFNHANSRFTPPENLSTDQANELIAMCMVTEDAKELKLEESYPAWVVPTVQIDSLERKLKEMAESIQKLRQLYDTHRNRYPLTEEDTKISIVRTVCESPAVYLTSTVKEIKMLAEILANGYDQEKVIQRAIKALQI
jgi:hypothetical protein